MHHRFPARAACAFALAFPAVAQLQPLTTTLRPHLDAALCPDAMHVAFRVGPQALGIVHVVTGVESTLHTSAAGALSSFVWAPDSASIYFADGTRIARTDLQGNVTPIVNAVVGSEVQVVAIDPLAQWLYGTRRDAGLGVAAIWRVALPGGGLAADVVVLPGHVDEVRMDDVGRYLLLRHWTGATPAPASFLRWDAQGNVLLTMATVNALAESAQWAVPPGFFVVSTPSPSHTAPQVLRLSSAGVPLWLTDDPLPHRRIATVAGSHEVFHETVSPTGGGTTLATVPNHGGGVMLTHAGQPLVLDGGAAEGGLSFDAAETTLAFCAGTSASDPFPQVYVVPLEEDLHVHPTLQTGRPFTMEQFLDNLELGAVAVADRLAPAPLQVPPLAGDFWLDTAPGHMTVVLTGIGNGSGPIGATWTIPAQPQLVGVRLWFQGLRVDPALAGSFTRLGYYQVF